MCEDWSSIDAPNRVRSLRTITTNMIGTRGEKQRKDMSQPLASKPLPSKQLRIQDSGSIHSTAQTKDQIARSAPQLLPQVSPLDVYVDAFLTALRNRSVKWFSSARQEHINLEPTRSNRAKHTSHSASSQPLRCLC